jgi:hypothetical protein
MLQHIRIITSIANGLFRDILILLVALSGLSQVGTVTPMVLQQFLANGHLKNKCLNFFLTLENAQLTNI